LDGDKVGVEGNTLLEASKRRLMPWSRVQRGTPNQDRGQMYEEGGITSECEGPALIDGKINDFQISLPNQGCFYQCGICR
jgi:hypothetical protein